MPTRNVNKCRAVIMRRKFISVFTLRTSPELWKIVSKETVAVSLGGKSRSGCKAANAGVVRRKCREGAPSNLH